MPRRGNSRRQEIAERWTPCLKQNGGCLSDNELPLHRCNEAIHSPLPQSESMCLRRLNEVPVFSDPLRRDYASLCGMIDLSIADPSLNRHQIDARYESIESNMESLVENSQANFERTENLVIHVNARLQLAALGMFYHRASGSEQPPSKALLDTTHSGYMNILADFKYGIYAPFATELATTRIKLETMVLLSRRLDREAFPYPALDREENSQDITNNHRYSIVGPYGKVPVQVQNSEYYSRNKRGHGVEKSAAAAVIIHSDIVNLLYTDRETIVQIIVPQPTMPEETFLIPYEDHDPEISKGTRGIGWYAKSSTTTSKQEPEAFEFVQEINGTQNDIISMLVREAQGERLSLTERNLLNAASHRLMALVQKVIKQKK